MEQNEQNSQKEKDTESEELKQESFSGPDIDPRKLNITLALGGILLILLMWYISSKLF